MEKITEQFLLSLFVGLIALSRKGTDGVQMCPESCECSDRVLDCRDRRLNSIPDLRPFRYYDNIDLSGNNFSVVDINMFVQINTRHLDLSRSNITRFTMRNTSTAISRLEKTLNLSHNALLLFPTEFFELFETYVETVDFSYNKIPAIPRAIFDDCQDLETLLLNHNRIQLVHALAFQGANSLSRIDLSYNKLSSLPRNLDLKDSVSVSLEGNEWNCDCHQRWQMNFNILKQSAPTCRTPDFAMDRLITSLSYDEFVCAPTFNNGSLLIEANLDQKIELVCPAESDPPIAEVLWSFRGRHPAYTIVTKPDKPLTIERLSEATTGRYWCTVWSKGGNLTLSLTLSVRRIVTEPKAKESEGTTVPTFGWPNEQITTITTTIPSAKTEFKVPVFGIIFLTVFTIFLFFAVVALIVYTHKLRTRLRNKQDRPAALFTWTNTLPAPQLIRDRPTLTAHSGYMHLLRNPAAYNTNFRWHDSWHNVSLTANPVEYSATCRKRMLPTLPLPHHTLHSKTSFYHYDPEHTYDTLGAHRFSSNSECSSHESLAVGL